MKYKNMTDEEIITYVRKNEKYAIDELIVRYKELVKIKARAYFLVGADTDDIMQEGMIGLYKAIRDYKEDKKNSFKTFAELCINRQIISAIKAATRNKHTPLNNYISINEVDIEQDNLSLIDIIIKEENNPEKVLIDKENIKDINLRIQTNLSQLERNTLKLYLRGMNYNKISEELKTTPKAIDNALQRIKNKLAKTLL